MRCFQNRFGAPNKHSRPSRYDSNLLETPDKYMAFKIKFGPVANAREINEFQNPIRTCSERLRNIQLSKI